MPARFGHRRSYDLAAGGSGYNPDPDAPLDPDDPLALVMAPPPDETPTEREARRAREASARAISEAIDEQLKAERASLRKRREKVVKLLLLGQGESGKSTTLRQFQRLYTPNAFREERILWRSVIQLNLVRSVRAILDALAADDEAFAAAAQRARHASFSLSNAPAPAPAPAPRPGPGPHTRYASASASDDEDNFGFDASNGYGGGSGSASPPPGLGGFGHGLGLETEAEADDGPPEPEHVYEYEYDRSPDAAYKTRLHALTLRLLPLRGAEQLLAARLVPSGEDEATEFGNYLNGPGGSGSGSSPKGVNEDGAGGGGGGGKGRDGWNWKEREREIFVRHGARWKGCVAAAAGGGVPPGSGFGLTNFNANLNGSVEEENGRSHSHSHSHARSRSRSRTKSKSKSHSQMNNSVGMSTTDSQVGPTTTVGTIGSIGSIGTIGTVGATTSVGSVTSTGSHRQRRRKSESTSLDYSNSNGNSNGNGNSHSKSNGNGNASYTVTSHPSNTFLASSTTAPPDEATTILHSLRADLRALWFDKGVRACLKRRKVRVEEMPGFFLDDLDRITSLTYLPSDDDVLKARLKTVGVSEYTFAMETAAGRESGHDWRIFDVGGARSQVATWVPFFDDVDAIIFLAPISCFDQVLAEDRTVNRLEDSVLLWKMICSNKLLAHVELVLFLNKCDILERKLARGVRLARYVRSFQDRTNDSETVQKYFRAKFAAIQREYSPNPRKFYGFCTSVTEITTTSGILASVRDMVVREHLKRSKLL